MVSCFYYELLTTNYEPGTGRAKKDFNKR